AALGATTPQEFIIAVATIYGTVLFTDLPARAEAIADQIEAERPDLIGLQEVSLWTTTGPAPPGFDFLAILQQALDDRGLSYSVAAVSDNASIGPVPLAYPLCAVPEPLGACLVLLQDRDVILVNDDNPDLSVFNSQSGRYVAQAEVPTPVGVLSFDRGWASVDGTFEGKKFRFVNTHLEVEGNADVQEDQGREFLAGPAKAGGAVIAVGDFNSAADGSTTTTYADLTKSYFDDAWSSDDPGYTCCQNSTLTNFPSGLGSAIDFVFTHGASGALGADVIGDAPFQMAPPLWPSDHAGVAATVRIH
ncbi:MAG: endonuclease/exonuclease/phosphatase family protein, partial [Deltaproteobacteria bacterium]|nr:endonuclease/exonuclease/phosphatase family protein [Deltaproteobacteria bacterium]